MQIVLEVHYSQKVHTSSPASTYSYTLRDMKHLQAGNKNKKKGHEVRNRTQKTKKQKRTMGIKFEMRKRGIETKYK